MSNQLPPNDPSYIKALKILGPFLLSAAGLTGGYKLAQQITPQPVLQIIIALGTGLIVYAFSFLSKVWQKWEPSLIDKTATGLPSYLHHRFAGYRRRYLYYLTHAHRVVEFNGLLQRPAYNRDVDRIFVEPETILIAPHLISSHPLKRVQIAPTNTQQNIWHYLNNNQLGADALVILGAAGSGKTTLLKYLTFTLSQPRLSPQIRKRYKQRSTIPILLYLREHITSIKSKPDCTLPDLVQAHVQEKGRLTLPAQWIEQQCQQGKCLIMLDGLDEVATKEDRQLIITWVRKQLLAYAKNRFILTSRPHGYMDAPLDDVAVLNIQPFTLEQIKSFIKKWYLIDELMRSPRHDPGVQIRANQSAGYLLSSLNQKPALLELAVNPLLLTMIATLASTGSSLPENRLTLYREIFQVLLYRRREAIGISSTLSIDQKLEILLPLAFHMQDRSLLEIEYEQIRRIITPFLASVSPGLQPTAFLQDIEQHSGLFIEVSPGNWSFAHKTLQEYLTATSIKNRHRESILLKRIADDWWHETICFYCAQADATKIIQACLAQADSSVQMLNLALECNSQMLKADALISQHIDTLLQTGIEDPDRQKRSIVAEALLKQRLEKMTYLREDVYVDTSPITCAEYQLFLDAESLQENYYHPWHWQTDTFQPGQGNKPLLAACRRERRRKQRNG